MQTHPAGAGLPVWSGAVTAQSGELVPRLTAIRRAEHRGIFDARVNRIRIGERRLQVPHAFEFPRVLRAVVPHMRGEWFARAVRGVVHELVALGEWHAIWSRGWRTGRRAWLMPRLAGVIRALNDLPEPAAVLRCEDAIRIERRRLQVINLPTGKVRAANGPLLALAI